MADAGSLGQAYAEILLRDGAFKAGLSSSLGSMKSWQTNIAKYAKITLGIAGGAAIVQQLKQSVNVFMDWDTALRNVWTLTTKTWQEMQTLGSQVERLSLAFGKTGTQGLQSLYEIYSSGFQGAEAMKVLEASLVGARAGLTEVNTWSKAVITVLNAWKKPAEEASYVTDVLWKVVERGVITGEQVASTFGNLAAIAAPLRSSLEEVAGAMMTLTRQGISADESVTAITSAIMAIAKPSETAQRLIERMGYSSGVAMMKEMGFAAALKLLVDAMGEENSEITDLIPNKRALLAVMSLAGTSAKEYADDMDAAAEASGSAAVASEKQKGAADQASKASAQWSTALKDVGKSISDLLPIVTTLISLVDKLVAEPLALLIQMLGQIIYLGNEAAKFILTGFKQLGQVIASPFVAAYKATVNLVRGTDDVTEAIETASAAVDTAMRDTFSEAVKTFGDMVDKIDGVVFSLGQIPGAINAINFGTLSQIAGFDLEGGLSQPTPSPYGELPSLGGTTSSAPTVSGFAPPVVVQGFVQVLDRLSQAVGKVSSAIAGGDSDKIEAALDDLWTAVSEGSPTVADLILSVKNMRERAGENSEVLTYLYDKLDDARQQYEDLIPVLKFYGMSTEEAEASLKLLTDALTITAEEAEKQANTLATAYDEAMKAYQGSAPGSLERATALSDLGRVYSEAASLQVVLGERGEVANGKLREMISSLEAMGYSIEETGEASQTLVDQYAKALEAYRAAEGGSLEQGEALSQLSGIYSTAVGLEKLLGDRNVEATGKLRDLISALEGLGFSAEEVEKVSSTLYDSYAEAMRAYSEAPAGSLEQAQALSDLNSVYSTAASLQQLLGDRNQEATGKLREMIEALEAMGYSAGQTSKASQDLIDQFAEAATAYKAAKTGSLEQAEALSQLSGIYSTAVGLEKLLGNHNVEATGKLRYLIEALERLGFSAEEVESASSNLYDTYTGAMTAYRGATDGSLAQAQALSDLNGVYSTAVSLQQLLGDRNHEATGRLREMILALMDLGFGAEAAAISFESITEAFKAGSLEQTLSAIRAQARLVQGDAEKMTALVGTVSGLIEQKETEISVAKLAGESTEEMEKFAAGLRALVEGIVAADPLESALKRLTTAMSADDIFSTLLILRDEFPDALTDIVGRGETLVSNMRAQAGALRALADGNATLIARADSLDSEANSLENQLGSAATAVSDFSAAVSSVSLAGLQAGIDSLMATVDQGIATAQTLGDIDAQLSNLQAIAGLAGNRETIERVMNGDIWGTLSTEAQAQIQKLYENLPASGMLGQTNQQIADEQQRAADEAQRAAETAAQSAQRAAEDAARDAEEATRKAAEDALKAFDEAFLSPIKQAASTGDYVAAAEAIRAMAQNFGGLMATASGVNSALAAAGDEQLTQLDVLQKLTGAESQLTSVLGTAIEAAKAAGDFATAAALEVQRQKIEASRTAPEAPKTNLTKMSDWLKTWSAPVFQALDQMWNGISGPLGNFASGIESLAAAMTEKDPAKRMEAFSASLSSAVSAVSGILQLIVSGLEERRAKLEQQIDLYIGAFRQASNVLGSITGGSGPIGQVIGAALNAVVSAAQMMTLEGTELVQAGLSMVFDFVTSIVSAFTGFIAQSDAYQATQEESAKVWKAIADLMGEFLWPLAAAIRYLREYLGIQDAANESLKTMAETLNVPSGWKSLQRIIYEVSNPDEGPMSYGDDSTGYTIPSWAEPFGEALAQAIMGLLESYGITSWSDLLAGVREKATELWEWITGKLPEIMESAKLIIDSIRAWLDKHGLNIEGIIAGVKKAVDWFITDAPGFVNKALTFLDGVLEAVAGTWKWIVDNFPTWDELRGAIDNFLAELGGIMDFDGLNVRLDAVKNAIDLMKSAMVYTLATVAGAIVGAIAGGSLLGLNSIISAALGAASGFMVSAILDKVGTFDEGGIVPGQAGKPYLAMVHAGEEIRTPAQQMGGTPIQLNVIVGGKTLGSVLLKELKSANVVLNGNYVTALEVG